MFATWQSTTNNYLVRKLNYFGDRLATNPMSIGDYAAIAANLTTLVLRVLGLAGTQWDYDHYLLSCGHPSRFILNCDWL